MNPIRKHMLGLLIAAPFVIVLAIFLLWPTLSTVGLAFIHDGHFSTHNMVRAMSGDYRQSFIQSARLSLMSSIIGGGIGLVMAVYMRSAPQHSRRRSIADSWSAVASQLGGLPLAFAFIALLGSQGLLTRGLKVAGFDIEAHGFTLAGMTGWVIAYLYFQIPLMFLVMTPAISGLKDTWFEAATSLGASNARAWRSVALPILMPSILTGFVLLFVNAFSAYATAYALSTGAGQLVPLQIRFILQGNVITGEDELGYAIVAWTLLLLLAALGIVTVLQRRVSKWSEAS